MSVSAGASPSGTATRVDTITTSNTYDFNFVIPEGMQFDNQQALEDFITNKADFRTDIGAGTSNLALGTTATTALAGNTTTISRSPVISRGGLLIH